MAQEVAAARYAAPTERYPHKVLGDAVEYGALAVTLSDGANLRALLPESLVFEDTAPRIVDLDGRDGPEIVVVESDAARGARLAVWAITPDGLERLAHTPFIGTRFRWLAPAGAADLDGDGRVEIAYVDRPHLARILRVWRYLPGDGATGPRLAEVAAAAGHTNHRIGARDIAGGIRTCAGRAEIVTASADWTRLLATRLEDGNLVSRDIGPHTGRASFAVAMDCR